LYLNDNQDAWILQDDGQYQLIHDAQGVCEKPLSLSATEKPVSAQAQLLKQYAH